MKQVKTIFCLIVLYSCLGLLKAEQAVISEIMYHPKGDLPEYLEISNNTVTPLDIANWSFSDGVDYRFPDFTAADVGLTFLRPYQRILVSSVAPEVLRQAYDIAPTIRVYGPWEGALDNAGERVTLSDKNGVVVCTVRYDNRGEWPLAADGAGHSLALKDPDKFIDDWRVWAASGQLGGTPGTSPVRSAETPAANPEVNLLEGLPVIDFGDVWRYHDQNEDLGTAWRDPDYDDSSWQSGPGLFGFENSALPSPGIQTSFFNDTDLNNLITYYLRAEFEVTGNASSAILTIDQILDDAAVYYVNGVEIGRSRMPGGSVDWKTTASGTVGDAALETNVLTYSGSAIRSGRNVVAVEVHQTNSSSSDVVFGARIKIAVPVQSGVVINEVLPSTGAGGFIEFYNPGGETVNLRDYFLTDDAGDLTKHRIDSDLTLPPSGFAALPYAETGFPLAATTSLFLVDSDGSTVLNGISGSIPPDGRSLGRKPAGGASWFLFVETTPGSANISQESLAGSVRLNELHFNEEGLIDWVEFYNDGETEISVDGLWLSPAPDVALGQALSGVIPAKGARSWDVLWSVPDEEITLYLMSGKGSVLQGEAYSKPAAGSSLQAFPNGSREWYSSNSASRDALNDPERRRDVVINEIMYDPPSNETRGEFIELYNRGGEAVDLSGWEFVDGVQFTFPQGTLLESGAYLVLAADEAWFRGAYGGGPPVLGDYDGVLSNNGERVKLVDSAGNLVDEVSYETGGRWPDFAHGEGSSMELLHPWMDNDFPSAWADSDETAKSQFQTYEVTGTYQQMDSQGGPSDYKELHLHLVGDAYVILEDIRMTALNSSANLIQNGNSLSNNGRSDQGWLRQGTHWATRLEAGGSELHIIADGHGDNRANRVEIDVPGLQRNQQYRVSFRARWIYGPPRLIVQTWDHSIEGSIGLTIPRNLGTPGAANSRILPGPAAQVDELIHSPAVPASSDAVLVTARVTSHDPVQTVTLHHRPDNSTASAAWSEKPMFDDGQSGGDEVAGDGVYTGSLTEYQNNGQVVQFFVSAISSGGRATLQPKGGRDLPAMYAVSNRQPQGNLRSMRFVVSELDIDAISDGDGPTGPYGYLFPRLSNHYFNATLIINEEKVIYNCEIRNSGSPWTRGGLDRGKYKIPEDQAFRNHVKFMFDNDATNNERRYHNRMHRHMLYLLGHPGNENEFIQFALNNGNFNVKEETEPVANDFLDRVYENGTRGELYRIDDQWWFTDSWNRTPRDATWRYKGTDDPGLYRIEWMKRTREGEDDYTALISFFKTVTENQYSQEQIERMIDPHLTTMMAAVRGYSGDWDSFTLNRGKNGYFYRKPDDGRFMFFHWDSDLAFQSGHINDNLIGSGNGSREYLMKPYNLRLMKYYLADLYENIAGGPRLAAWMNEEEDSSDQFTINAGLYENWFRGRAGRVGSFLGSELNLPFEISTNNGNPLNTSQDTVDLAGSAPLTVFETRVEGHPEAEFRWSGDGAWRLSGVQLKSGENILNVQSMDHFGNVLSEEAMTVQKTGNAAPVAIAEADPASWRVSVSESFSVTAKASFDPEGGPLTFDWSVDPEASIQTEGSAQDAVSLAFERPGLYDLTLTVADDAGLTGLYSKEIAVYAPDGFASFNDARLEDFWSIENTQVRSNSEVPSYFSLEEKEGWLVVFAEDDAAKPLSSTPPVYPAVMRPLPETAGWSLHSKVRLLDRQLGAFDAGILVECLENGDPVRYSFGYEDGRFLAVKKVASDGTETALKKSAKETSELTLRVRSEEGGLVFEEYQEPVWVQFDSQPLPNGARPVQGGLFVATFEPQAVRSAFDFAMLVDPSSVSLREGELRVSEIMYNPPQGNEYEFLELVNVGSGPISLNGARFTQGIDYVFGDETLAADEYLVLVQDRVAFRTLYGDDGIRIASGTYAGNLRNEGETLEIVDANGGVLLSFAYDSDGDWPSRAQGFGSSLELLDFDGDPNGPGSWHSSTEYLGTPGGPGMGDVESIVINEVLSHTDPPLEDAIELHNPTANPVDISGWYLSDDLTELKKYRLPAGTVIEPGGYYAAYEQQFRLTNPLIPFSLDSVQGDEVRLTAAGADGELAWFVDDVSFSASENGVSFGRFPNGTGDLTRMETLTFGSQVSRFDPPELIVLFRQGEGAPNSDPRVGPVVISEIHYEPPAGEEEYLRLSNNSSMDAYLYDTAVLTNTWRIANAIEFEFPRDVVLPANGSLLVVPIDPGVFRTRYQIPDSIQIFGPFTGRLDNAGETIELYKPDPPQTRPPDEGFVPQILVEEVDYDDDPPWPQQPVEGGKSLKRIDLNAYGNDYANWAFEVDEPEGDRDGDGMPDEWETANGLDPDSSADAFTDDDGDGMNNLGEYRAMTDPQDPSDALSVAIDRTASGGLELRFEAVAGMRYEIQFRSDLAVGAWQPLESFEPETSQTIVEELSAPAGDLNGYYRLIVSP